MDRVLSRGSLVISMTGEARCSPRHRLNSERLERLKVILEKAAREADENGIVALSLIADRPADLKLIRTLEELGLCQRPELLSTDLLFPAFDERLPGPRIISEADFEEANPTSPLPEILVVNQSETMLDFRLPRLYRKQAPVTVPPGKWPLVEKVHPDSQYICLNSARAAREEDAPKILVIAGTEIGMAKMALTELARASGGRISLVEATTIA